MRQLATAHHKLGNSLGNPNYPNIGDSTGALEHLQKAIAVLQRGAKAHPSNASFPRNIAVMNSNIADVLSSLNRRDEALKHQQAAQSEFERLAAADPSNVAAWNDVAISRSKIAECSTLAGGHGDAVVEFERALEIHLKLAATDPENANLKLELASDYNRLATVQAKAGGPCRNPRQPRPRGRDGLGRCNRRIPAQRGMARRGRPWRSPGARDAYAAFARAPRQHDAGRRISTAAERDYAESVAIFSALQQAGSIEGTDLETLENNRRALEKVRGERSAILSAHQDRPEVTSMTPAETVTAPELPAHVQLIQMCAGGWVAAALYAAAKLGIADHLADGARSAAELAPATGTHAPSLHRFMRTLAGFGILDGRGGAAIRVDAAG